MGLGLHMFDRPIKIQQPTMKLLEFFKPRKLYKLETCYGHVLGYCRARNPDHAKRKFIQMGLIPNNQRK